MSDQLDTVTAKDQTWQMFVDWARGGDIPTMLEQSARLMRGQIDPYYGPIDVRYVAFVAQHGWSGVLQVFADLQQERDLVP